MRLCAMVAKAKQGQTTVQDILRFFQVKNIYTKLKITLTSLLPSDRKNIIFELNAHGGSYTDNVKLVVGLPKCFYDKSDEEKYIALKALVGHESQHIRSSSFSAFSNFIKQGVKYLQDNYGISSRYAEEVFQHIGNSVEDGRIERILGNKWRGYVKYLKFLNLSIWEAQPVKGESELYDFLYSITSYAVTGMLPKDFNKVYAKSELNKNIKKIKKDIIRGVESETCQKCLDICWEIFKKVEPYLVKLLKDMKQIDIELLEWLIKLINEFKTDDEIDFNPSGGISVHIKTQKKSKKDSKKDSKDDETGESGGKSEKKDDAEKKDDSAGDLSNEGSDGSENKDGSSKDKNGSDESQGADNLAQDQDGLNGAGGAQDDKKKEKSSKKGDVEKSDDEAAKEAMDSIKQDVIDEAKEKLKENKDSPKSKMKEGEQLTQKELDELAKKYKQFGIAGFKEEHEIYTPQALPSDVKLNAIRFRNQIERLFKSKEPLTVRSQKKGVIDLNGLYKVGMDDYNVFYKKGIASLTDYVAFVLKDNSGSMSGNKQKEACAACGILEEGLRGIIPFKIAAFTSSSRNVVHYCIKDFNEKTPVNKSWSFFRGRSANGGNADGYSIRVATMELEKRPEKDKILVVLSDGLPSDPGGDAGEMDVRNAVSEARKKGILVIAVVFGEGDYREAYINNYKKMYEKNIISCKPEELTTNLVETFKRILKR